jgi:pimeloyl-ACP methyl ester carboxylesterase
MHVFYLHGFASSAQSKKAAYLGERLRARGVALRCPDFNEPDFESLTLTRMLDQLARELGKLDQQPVALIGSSLGAVVGIHTAARLPERIDRLILLAPAVVFPRDAATVLGAERVAQWQQTGSLEVFHFAQGGTRSLSYAFCEDGLRYDAMAADIRQPTIIFQGRRDASVDYRMVEQFAASRPNIALTLLDDDHQLMASLPRIWHETAVFLELT